MSGYSGHLGAKDNKPGVKSIPNPLAKGGGGTGIGGIWQEVPKYADYHKPSISYTGTTLLDYK